MSTDGGRRETQKEESTTAAQEIKAHAKQILSEMSDKGRKQGGESEMVYDTRVKMQGIVIAVEILRFIDGQIDVLLDQSNVVKVYRHEISVTPMTTDLKKIRSILTRGEQGRSEDGKEVLCGENWSMTSNGLTLSIRFSGRHPADAAGLISEPAQPTLDLMADSGASASEFMRMMKMISTYRADAEAAALEHSEFTYERRKENREREAAEKDEKEERSRPERLWKAVKDGKSKTITEILEKPFVRTAPAVPLVKLTDDAGWTLLHWAAFKDHRDACTVLIRFNSDPLARDCTGNTPFQLACANGAEEASLYLMERMMKHDAAWAVNSGNNIGGTALLDCTCNGHHELAEKLYKAKCDWLPGPQTRSET